MMERHCSWDLTGVVQNNKDFISIIATLQSTTCDLLDYVVEVTKRIRDERSKSDIFKGV